MKARYYILIGIIALVLITTIAVRWHYDKRSLICGNALFIGTTNLIGIDLESQYTPYCSGLVDDKGNTINHNLDFACYYDNPNTQCAKTQYCPTHWSKEKCLANNGTWELESLSRDMVAYPELVNECAKIGGCRK